MPGKAAGVVVPCTAKCIHPKLTDPSSGRTSEVEEWDTSGLAGEEGYIGYTFDNEWELVSGPWTIQVFWDSKLKAQDREDVQCVFCVNELKRVFCRALYRMAASCRLFPSREL